MKIKIPVSQKSKKKGKKNKLKSNDSKIKKADDFTRFKKFSALLQAFYEASPSIRKSVAVEKLEINSRYGGEDAAFTGIAVGIAYAEIYKLIGFLSIIFTVSQPVITITPVFEDKAVFEISLEGIIRTKAAHIIFTVSKFYSEYKKALIRKD